MEQAKAACQHEPDKGALLNTLGVAQYRAEQYREAVATLTLSARLNSEGVDVLQPADLAFLRSRTTGSASQTRPGPSWAACET